MSQKHMLAFLSVGLVILGVATLFHLKDNLALIFESNDSFYAEVIAPSIK